MDAMVDVLVVVISAPFRSSSPSFCVVLCGGCFFVLIGFAPVTIVWLEVFKKKFSNSMESANLLLNSFVRCFVSFCAFPFFADMLFSEQLQFFFSFCCIFE